MVASPLWPRVVTALVEAMRAVDGYRAPTDVTSTGITVYDSTEVGLVEEHPTRFLVIAWSGDPDRGEDSGQADHAVAAIASTTRPVEETGTIRCLAVAQLGDATLDGGSVATARSDAYALLHAVDLVCRGSSPGPTLGLDSSAGQLLWAQVTRHRVAQYLDQGTSCELDFDVSYRGRI